METVGKLKTWLARAGFIFISMVAVIALYILISGKEVQVQSSIKLPPQARMYWEQYKAREKEILAMAKEILIDLLQIRTVRGNEHVAAYFIQNLFHKEGISSKTLYDPKDPTRMSLFAVLHPPKKSEKKGLLITGHLDVVEADAKGWSALPFSGKMIGNRIYGRGAIDMKGMLTLEILSFLLLHRLKVPLQRPIGFLAVADEESGGKKGMRFIAKNHRHLLERFSHCINEGGVITKGVAFPNTIVANIQIAEKGILWIRAKSKGEEGHGSTPPSQQAIEKLRAFLNDLMEIDRSMHIVEENQKMFAALGKGIGGIQGFFLKRLGNPIVQMFLSPILSKNRYTHAITHNTFSITMVKAGQPSAINVIPSTATAQVDIRLLPGFDTRSYFKRIENIAKAHGVQVSILSATNPTSSPDADLIFQHLAHAVRAEIPNAIIAPMISPGGTDSAYLRRIGLRCYGLVPFTLNPKDLAGMHGKDENISIENLKQGLSILFRAVLSVALSPPS